MNHQITEGYMPFIGYQTYYRIVGEPSDKAPLLLLHGGPGSTHNYFEVLDCIADTGRQVISYDQIGCGNSTAQYIFLIMQDDLHFDDEAIATALNVKRTSVRSMRSRIKGREK